MSYSLQPHRLQHTRLLFFTVSQNLLKLMSIDSVMSSNHLILCHPLLLLPSIFPASGSFPVSQLFAPDDQSIGTLTSVLPVNIHGWFPLGLTGLISLLSKGLFKSLLQHHSSKASILWHSAFFIVYLSHPYMTTGKTIALTRRTFVSKVMPLLFNMLSMFVIAFLLRSKSLLISWLQYCPQWFWSPRK